MKRKGYSKKEINDRTKIITGLLKERASVVEMEDSEEIVCWICGKIHWGGFLVDGDRAIGKGRYRKIKIALALQ